MQRRKSGGGPMPGTPAYAAHLAARLAALGLTVVERDDAPEAAADAPAPEPTAAPLAWVEVLVDEPPAPVTVTPPGPGLAAGSILGCAYGRAHHCHWLWWGAIGRYCCHACQGDVWRRIPKGSINDMRLKGE